MQNKECTRCCEAKPATTAYYKSSSTSPDKLHHRCKACDLEASKEIPNVRDNSNNPFVEGNYYPEGTQLAHTMLATARKRAKRMGLPFDLTIEDIQIPRMCPYLGIPLYKSNSGYASYNSPSLDKIVPELGYVKGNVRVISYKANAMKQDADAELLRRFAESILKLH